MKARRILLPERKREVIRKGATQLRVVSPSQPFKEEGVTDPDRPACWIHCVTGGMYCDPDEAGMRQSLLSACPYPVGSRLWVPETWQVRDDTSFYTRDPLKLHRTDHPRCKELWESMQPARYSKQWRFPVTMPYWAWEATSNHILIQVTDVRVEQVQEISRDDARAEGIAEYGHGHEWDNRTSAENFAHVWDSTHPKPEEKWAAKPWVWPLTFELLEGLT